MALSLKSLSEAKKKLASAMSACFVLFIGDEGAILIHIKGGKVCSRQFFADASPQNLKEMRERFAADARAPLLLVIDTMDQSYMQQTLPPVSSLSVQKLIRRRLERDFAGTGIKSALLLGREAQGRRDWNFLIVALDKTPELSAWLDFVAELPNRLDGIYAVPVEAERIVRDLERGMGILPEGKGRPQWTFLVSHNKAGGFRQVILRNGHLAFTRMAQPIGESTPEVIAGNIEQEIQNTMDYMRRLDFNPQDGLNIYIIASAALKPLIDGSRFKASALRLLTPHEAAGYLNIVGATQPTDQFGDVFLAAAIGLSARHVLRLSLPQFARADRLYRLIRMQRAAALGIASGMAMYALGLGYTTYAISAKDAELSAAETQHEKSLGQLRAEIRQSDLDVEKAGDMIELFQQMQKEKLAPAPAIAKASAAIKPPVTLKAVDWSLDAGKGKQPPATVLTLTLQAPGGQSADQFESMSKQVLAEVGAAFSGDEVAYVKLPSGFSGSERLDLTFSDDPSARNDANAPLEMDLAIRQPTSQAPLAAEKTP
ncbi:MAG: hypothetical protein KGJ06_00520 [Pseudomonadota bacterium]|nr:hypothetical protein [Pseudomonadota bacterium]